MWFSDTDLNIANRRVQTAHDNIQEWSTKKINVSKSEATIFSSAANEAKWRPTLNINGVDIPFNASPKFLGVHLDKSLSF